MNKYSLRTSCNIVCYKSTFVFFVKDTANALAWLCMIIQSIRYVILTSGLHALAVALSCNPKGNFPFGLHNLISFLRMKLNGLASHV